MSLEVCNKTNLPFTRAQLIDNFSVMYGQRNSNRYTHFVPVLPKSSRIAEVIDVKEPQIYPIYECNCGTEMSRTYRELFVEDPLLEKVGALFDIKKPICLYSLGSGSCYQELSLCVKLAKKGYNVKNIVLVDNVYSAGKQDLRIVQFSTYSRLLFPDVQISAYDSEKTYLEEINNLKQSKPDIIVCVDMEEAQLFRRKNTYIEMLGSSSNQSIFTYHNYDSKNQIVSETEIIQGQGCVENSKERT